ncbi:MAG: TetR/AcrR family transcriptional regulator [Nocardioides sp.]|uniref:TetR/AcrR family transcriptional regulator n=1 Tax=Nocardioides sp. TaxID=35761 RepID=UPI0039E64CDD
MDDGTAPPSPAVARGTRRRERTGKAILQAAERLLDRGSLEDIRVEDIAAEAGVSPASVYVHFGTKQGVIAGLVEHVLDIVDSRLSEVADSDLSPIRKAHATGHAYLDLLLEHPVLVRYIAAGEVSGPVGPIENMVGERLEALRQRFEAQISLAVGTSNPHHVDSRLLSYFLFGAWNGITALTLRQDGAGIDRQDAEAAIRQFLRLVELGALGRD